MSHHTIFWPFDGEPSFTDMAKARPAGHIGDSLRIGVLAGQEEAEVRMEGHFMQCPQCHDSAMSLWERMPADRNAALFKEVSCAEARNDLFRYLDQGRSLESGVLYHLLTCEDCSDHFVEPAKALYRLDTDEESIGAGD